MPDDAPPDARVIITRESRRDGTLLMAARERMPPGTVIYRGSTIVIELQ